MLPHIPSILMNAERVMAEGVWDVLVHGACDDAIEQLDRQGLQGVLKPSGIKPSDPAHRRALTPPHLCRAACSRPLRSHPQPRTQNVRETETQNVREKKTVNGHERLLPTCTAMRKVESARDRDRRRHTHSRTHEAREDMWSVAGSVSRVFKQTHTHTQDSYAVRRGFGRGSHTHDCHHLPTITLLQ